MGLASGEFFVGVVKKVSP